MSDPIDRTSNLASEWASEWASDQPGEPPDHQADGEPAGSRMGWELSTAIVLFHDAVAARLGVNVTDHKALGALRRNGPLRPSAIAAELGVVPSAATGIVDRLVAAGLVERLPDPADRRGILIRALTDQTAVERTAFERIGERLGAFLYDLGERERRAVLDYIELTTRLLREETTRLRDQP